MSKNIDIKLQIESINVAKKELKKHFGEHYELAALSNSIPLLEELEKLREGRKEIPIATITFSKKDLQKMVDETVKDIELDIQGIRNKAIDDFSKAEDYLMNKIKEETADVNIDFEWRKVVCLDDIRRMLHQGLCDVAEQLKKGDADNE